MSRPEPLVSARWAAVLGAVGLGLQATAQLGPVDLRVWLAAVGSVLLYAATGELRQPEWAKGKALVPHALVPALGSLAVAAHGYAAEAGVPLAHLLGATMAAATGYARQETVAGGAK